MQEEKQETIRKAEVERERVDNSSFVEIHGLYQSFKCYPISDMANLNVIDESHCQF